jgi:hypothetical protein
LAIWPMMVRSCLANHVLLASSAKFRIADGIFGNAAARTHVRSFVKPISLSKSRTLFLKGKDRQVMFSTKVTCRPQKATMTSARTVALCMKLCAHRAKRIPSRSRDAQKLGGLPIKLWAAGDLYTRMKIWGRLCC